jgi:integrase
LVRNVRNSSLESRASRSRLRIRRTPYFVKIAKGLRLGYYRNNTSGSWVASWYRGGGEYTSKTIGVADDTVDADGSGVFDYWQAQDCARKWGESQRVSAGSIPRGPYRVVDAVTDYLREITAEKKPVAVKGAKYVFDAWVLPALGPIEIDKLTTDQINRWRNNVAINPRRTRTKKNSRITALKATPDNEGARRARKATANRILTVLKAALNRAFSANRISSDAAWRKVKPFRRVDEATLRYLSLDEARSLVSACDKDFSDMVKAALLTGCRYAELGYLKCSDFNNDSGTLSINLSKGKGRHVVLTEEGRTAFMKWTRSRPGSDPIFLRTDGKMWGPSHQQRPLKVASVRACIFPPANFHMLRHTHASHLAMNGTPMAVIARQLGHSDTRMTEKHYAHLAPNYVAHTIRANFPKLGFEADHNDTDKSRAA